MFFEFGRVHICAIRENLYWKSSTKAVDPESNQKTVENDNSENFNERRAP